MFGVWLHLIGLCDAGCCYVSTLLGLGWFDHGICPPKLLCAFTLGGGSMLEWCIIRWDDARLIRIVPFLLAGRNGIFSRKLAVA